MDAIHGLNGIDTAYERQKINYRPRFLDQKKTNIIHLDENQTDGNTNAHSNLESAWQAVNPSEYENQKTSFYDPVFDVEDHIRKIRFEPSFDPAIAQMQRQNEQLSEFIMDLNLKLKDDPLAKEIQNMLSQKKYDQFFEWLPNVSPLLMTVKHHHLIILNLFYQNNEVLSLFWEKHVAEMLNQTETESKMQWLTKEKELEQAYASLYQYAEELEDEFQSTDSIGQNDLNQLDHEVKQLRAKHNATNHIYYALNSRTELINPLIQHIINYEDPAVKEEYSFLQNQFSKEKWIKLLDFDLNKKHRDIVPHYHGFKLVGPKQYEFMSQHAYPLYNGFANEHVELLRELWIENQTNPYPILFESVLSSIENQRKQMQQATLDWVQLSRLEADSAYFILRQSQKTENLRAILQNFV